MDPQQYLQEKRFSDPISSLYFQQQQREYYKQQQQQQQEGQQQDIHRPQPSQQSQQHNVGPDGRRASSVGPTSRRSDRRQPIIIQNFELLPPGQSHLKRRSLSTANLFLSSASLRRETDVQALEKVQLFNNPGRLIQPLPGGPSLGHSHRPATSSSATVPSSSFNRNSPNWTSAYSDSGKSENSANSATGSLIKEQQRQTNTQFPNSQQQKDLGSHNGSKSNFNPEYRNENGPYSNPRVPTGSADTENNLTRAPSYPIISNSNDTPKKTKAKKQVTFADRVSIPWPYTLVHEKKMWSTGLDSVSPSTATFTEAGFHGTDINNNMDTNSFPSSRCGGNIFRPMASKHESDLVKTDGPPRKHQGILKNTSSGGSYNSNKKEDVSATFAPEAVDSGEHDDRVSFGESLPNACTVTDLEANHVKLHPSDVETRPHALNGQGSEQCVTDKTEYNIERAGEEGDRVRSQSTTSNTAVDSHLSINGTDILHYGLRSNLVLPNEGQNEYENIAPSSTRQDGAVTDDDVQSPHDGVSENKNSGNVERTETKKSVHIEQSANFDGDLSTVTNIEEHSFMEAEAESSGGTDQNQLLSNEHQPTNTETHGPTSAVSSYTVPQLADSIDLTDYVFKMSQSGGSASGKPPISGGFRPRPNNVRLSSKPDVIHSMSGTSGNMTDKPKVQPKNSEAATTSNTVVMRLKFLKDESDPTGRKSGRGSGMAAGDIDIVTMQVDGKSLQLTRQSSLASMADQGHGGETPELLPAPTRPVKPFNGKPGETYLTTSGSRPKTQGDVNTDYLMQMYSPTGERKANIDNAHNSINVKPIASSNTGGMHEIDRNNPADSISGPQSSLIQRSRIAATVTTPISTATVIIDGARRHSGNDIDYTHNLNNPGSARSSRASRRDMQSRKLAVTREDAFAFTPRSHERQRRLLTATLVGDLSPEFDEGATLTPRAVMHARARSSSATANSRLQRGRNLSAHERTMGAMESVFLPERLKSASSAAGGVRSGAKGLREGVAYGLGRTQLNRRLELLVLSTTRPNTAMERSRSNLS